MPLRLLVGGQLEYEVLEKRRPTEKFFDSFFPSANDGYLWHALKQVLNLSDDNDLLAKGQGHPELDVPSTPAVALRLREEDERVSPFDILSVNRSQFAP